MENKKQKMMIRIISILLFTHLELQHTIARYVLFLAPKARNVIAWATGPGELIDVTKR